jgi:putative sigma-54 modulation protein
MGTSAHTVNVVVTFKNTEATDALRSYATDKLSHSLKKFVHSDTEAHVILRIEKLRQIAEVSFHADGKDFAGKEESQDLYASIDALSDSIAHQLRKHKEKVTSHH